MKNLEFISEKRVSGEFKHLRLDFVVQQRNYKEMPEFIRIAKKFKADKCYFSLVSDWGTWSVEEYNHHAIWKTDHPEFEDFLKVMRNPIFDDPIIDLGNVTEYKNYSRK